jgi:hypothetical protein
MIFYVFSEFHLELKHYLRNQLSNRPLESLSSSQICPWFAQKTLERMRGMQLGPWAKEGSGSGKILARVSPERVGDGSRANPRPICGRRLGRGGSGDSMWQQ